MKLVKSHLWRLLLCFLTGLTAASASASSVSVQDDIARLEAASGGQSEISIDESTGVAGFIRFAPGTQLMIATGASTPQEKTRSFLDGYGSLLGLQNHETELVLVRETIDFAGRGRTRFRQVYEGLPVFGAELTSRFNRDGQLTAVSASTFPITDLNTIPSWQSDSAGRIAREHVARQGRARAQGANLDSNPGELMVFRTGLSRGVPGRNYLAWKFEVVNDSRSIREFVFVNAHTGKVLDQITGIHQDLDRKVSEELLDDVVWQDSENDPDPIPDGWDAGSPQQVEDWQNEIDGARETYNLFASITAGTWLSFDGADATMRTVNNDPNIACPNANWNGVTTNYCSGVTGDDTVAHEWGHAYTEYTANLVYQWQSGALNESYSDVWGEVVDFLNQRGSDTPDSLRTAGSCSLYGSGSPKNDNSYRWLSGEDDPGFGGAIRDMWRPTCYGDPGKVSDTQYWCSSLDNGGVHINSGIPNHGFALLVDGGTYNGQVITGLGLTKSAHIYWDSLQMLVPVSDFSDQADALEASCLSLVDVNLPALSTEETDPGLSGEFITAADCDQVSAIVNAVELRADPVKCNFTELFDSDPPERCLGRGELQSISLTDWELGIGGWTVDTHDIANPPSFDTPDWAVVANLPAAREGSAAFVANLNQGDCEADDESGALNLDSPVIQIPADSAVARLSINQWMATEVDWDGGNLKINVNGAGFEEIPNSAIEVSPYNATLFTAGVQNTNPLAGQPAWTGANGGSANGGWGQAQINLATVAGGGDEVQLRFDFGVDGCSGVIGWYVDEVELYSCSEEFSPLCGNGVIDHTEQCDDGNTNDADGCSAICEIEDGWECAAVIPPATIPDNSFEAGPGGGFWAESSTEFGSPVCDISCGTGGGTGPSDGSYWAWFGGIERPDMYEEASLSQTILIPSTATELTFDFELPACDSVADYLELRIDGNTVFTVNGADPACGTVGYTRKSVDVTAYADDSPHTIQFYSESFADNRKNTNFFVDNIVIPGVPSLCTVIPGPRFQSDPAPESTIAFGNQVILTESTPNLIQVENPGIEALNLSCSITGPGADQFNLLTCPSPVPVSGLAEVGVSCKPQSTGLKSASLDITTNDETQPVVSFPLTCTGVSVPRQVITPSPVIQVLPATDPVSIDVSYSTSTGDDTLSGLELRIHWDSTLLVFGGLSSVWATDLVSTDAACQADAANYDNDASTDCYATVLWSSGGNTFPGEGNTPTLLFTANFTGDLSPAASTRLNFSAGQLAPGYSLKATSAIVEEETIGPQTLFSDGFE